MYVIRRGCKVTLIESDRTVGEVIADLVISPFEREVLLSDALCEELGIMILSMKRGLWKLKDDPIDKIRTSYPPQYW